MSQEPYFDPYSTDSDDISLPAQDPQPKRHPVRAFFRILFSVLFTMTLIVSLLGAACVGTIRHTVTPEYVYTYMDNLDITEIPVTVEADGKPVTVTLEEAMRLGAEKIGLMLTKEDAVYILDGFSVPAVFSSSVQDLFSWFLYDGENPMPDPEKLTEMILSGVDSSLVGILFYVGDPITFISGLIDKMLDQLQMETLIEDILSPIRPFFSSFALVQLLVAAGVSLLFVFLLNDGRPTKGYGYIAVSTGFSGIVLTAVSAVMTVLLLYQGNSYSSYILDFLTPVRSTLLFIGIGGIIAGILSGGIAVICILIHRMSKRRNTLPMQDF